MPRSYRIKLAEFDCSCWLPRHASHVVRQQIVRSQFQLGACTSGFVVGLPQAPTFVWDQIPAKVSLLVSSHEGHCAMFMFWCYQPPHAGLAS
jgi:hypothetical protein